jgi:hypothetical protein
MYTQVTQKPKLKPTAPILELGRPSQVKASVHTPASGRWAGKNQFAVSREMECTSLCQHQPHSQ